jgi:hypothetical protein
MMTYYSGLGQFWRIMADTFLSLSDLYDARKITSIPEVVAHIKKNLVDNASQAIVYQVKIKGQTYDLIPKSVGLTFLADTAIPYVEAVFFRGTPFPGTISYNAQAYQIPYDQGMFAYGALYADPLPIGGAGIPPTLLMQDMRHFLPDYLHDIYKKSFRPDLRNFSKVDVLCNNGSHSRISTLPFNYHRFKRTKSQSHLSRSMDESLCQVKIRSGKSIIILPINR